MGGGVSSSGDLVKLVATHVSMQEGVLSIVGALFAANMFLGVYNSSSVQPVISVERCGFYAGAGNPCASWCLLLQTEAWCRHFQPPFSAFPVHCTISRLQERLLQREGGRLFRGLSLCLCPGAATELLAFWCHTASPLDGVTWCSFRMGPEVKDTVTFLL